jgi:hypothetical protein
MDHQDDVLLQVHFVEPGVEVPHMIDKPVAAVGSRAGVAHADIVRCQAPSIGHQARDDVSPEIRRRWIAVQENYRIAVTNIDIGHDRVGNGRVPPVRGIFGRDSRIGHQRSSESGRGISAPEIGRRSHSCKRDFRRRSDKLS